MTDPWQSMQDALTRAGEAQREEQQARERTMEWRRWTPLQMRSLPVDFGPREVIEDTPPLREADDSLDVYRGILHYQQDFLDRLRLHEEFEEELDEG